MFIPFCVYHYDTYMPLRRAHAHTCPQGSLMMPLWAKEAHTLGLGPNLTILPYLGLLLAFRASLVSARCRMVHRYGANTPPFLRAWMIPDQSARKLLLKICELLPGCQ